MSAPLYETCPKCGYRRQAGDTSPADRCPRCGLYFEKWLKRRFHRPLTAVGPLRKRLRRGDTATRPSPMAHVAARLRPLLLPEVSSVNALALSLRAALWLVLLLWGLWFITTDHRVMSNGLPAINHSIMHLIDLVFHEAGHMIFRLLGDFMMVLGGSLMQLLVPGVATWALLCRHHDPFGAAVTLWWFSQSLMDLAPYIHDARVQNLQLLGGGTGRDRPGSHDWHNLLGRTGMLEYDHALAWLVDGLGVLLMLAALSWSGLLLQRQYRAWRQTHS